MPQYGILVYSPPPADPMTLTPEYLASLDAYPAKVEELGGKIVTGFAFQPSPTAKSVRGGVVSDTPVVAGELACAGYYVLDAPDVGTAVKIAGLNPATAEGAVEIRPLFVPPSA